MNAAKNIIITVLLPILAFACGIEIMLLKGDALDNKRLADCYLGREKKLGESIDALNVSLAENDRLRALDVTNSCQITRLTTDLELSQKQYAIATNELEPLLNGERVRLAQQREREEKALAAAEEANRIEESKRRFRIRNAAEVAAANVYWESRRIEAAKYKMEQAKLDEERRKNQAEQEVKWAAVQAEQSKADAMNRQAAAAEQAAMNPQPGVVVQQNNNNGRGWTQIGSAWYPSR